MSIKNNSQPVYKSTTRITNKIKGEIQLPGAHKEKDDIEDDEGQGAPILSFKSQVKL